MSEYRSRRSPFEQGEWKGSPDRHAKKKKSKKSKKKSHQLPPEAKPYIQKAEDDDVQIIEAAGHGEEEGGSLTIKPPQTHIAKDKGHKHKKDRHPPRDGMANPMRERFYDGKKERQKDFDMGRDFRDAREIVRERKKEREMKEKEVAREITRREARKREESIKERERLERMELERRRERQIRDDHNPDKESRQQKRKDDRRQLLDNKRDRGRDEERQTGNHYRSRSREQDKPKDTSRSQPSTKNQMSDKAPSKKEVSSAPSNADRHGKSSGDKSESDQDTRRVVVDGSDDRDRRKSKKRYNDEEVVILEEGNSQDSSSKGKPQSSKSDREGRELDDSKEEAEVGMEERESEGESGLDSEDSDSDSSSSEEEEESSGEEEEDHAEDIHEESDREEEVVDRTDDGRGKVRSKFDDHSDVETPGRVSQGSQSDDNYVPDSPEMSDVEESMEDNLPIYLPAIQGCRSVEEFNCLNRIEEGTYGVVYRAHDKKTNEIVALKRLKMEKEKEGFPITSLREINTLLKAQHENIVTVREIVVGSNMDKIYIVMDFVEHDLKSLMENMKNPFLVGEVKTLLKQLLRAVRHLHDNWILHRDLKTSNLLLSHKGILKVGDFGLAREYGSPLRHYTPVVVTLWYRAPELLLGSKKYSTLIDMWSVGCIFAEFLLMKALWPGKSEIDQINKIFKDLGTPTEKIWAGVMELPGMKKVNFNDNPYNIIRNRFGSYLTDSGFNLLNKFFAYDPTKRITADEALLHDYFSESPLPVDPSMFPTWPARSEQTKKTVCSPKPPSGGKAYQKLMDEEESLASAGGFHMSSAAKGVSAQGMGFSLKF